MLFPREEASKRITKDQRCLTEGEAAGILFPVGWRPSEESGNLSLHYLSSQKGELKRTGQTRQHCASEQKTERSHMCPPVLELLVKMTLGQWCHSFFTQGSSQQGKQMPKYQSDMVSLSPVGGPLVK